MTDDRNNRTVNTYDRLDRVTKAVTSGGPDSSYFAFTLDGHSPRAVATALGREGIAVRDGDFCATGLIERLGLAAPK